MKNAKLKNLIYRIITETNDVDANGKTIPRQSYAKQHINILRLKKQIENDFRYYQQGNSEALTAEQVDNEKPVLLTVLTDSEIDYTEYLEGIKYYYNQLTDVPATDIEAVDALLNLLKDENRQ